jgi:hypothetical protein
MEAITEGVELQDQQSTEVDHGHAHTLDLVRFVVSAGGVEPEHGHDAVTTMPFDVSAGVGHPAEGHEVDFGAVVVAKRVGTHLNEPFERDQRREKPQ